MEQMEKEMEEKILSDSEKEMLRKYGIKHNGHINEAPEQYRGDPIVLSTYWYSQTKMLKWELGMIKNLRK